MANPVNDVAIVLDSNDKFVNWTGFNANFMVWFKGELYAGRADDTNRHLLVFDPELNDDQDVLGNDVAIRAFIETRQEAFGAIHERKKLRYLETINNAEQSTVTFSFKADGETSYQTLNSVPFTTSLKHRKLNFPIGEQAKRATFKAQNTNLGEDFGIEALLVGYESVPSVSGL
jgi:hypothetical protein